MKKELLIGCGNSRTKSMALPGEPFDWESLVTLDVDPLSGADVLHDLEQLPLPFQDNEFDEVHAYHVLEHTGRQGDYKFFFKQFEEFHRILKPGGHFLAVVPSHNTLWTWGDPGHTRIINSGTILFLSQKQYEQVGKSTMTDYRHIYKADFDIVFCDSDGENLVFALKAIK